MLRIGLLSDTHGYLDEKVFHHFNACDELWHAGDFGHMQVADDLRAFKPLRGVWGNVDGAALRYSFPEKNVFVVAGITVAMVHIGGYPGRYSAGVKNWLQQVKPALFIAGHSHIVKAVPDPQLQLLHLNPGAAGKQGWHKQRTLMRFGIAEKKIVDLELIELGGR